ncbi:hypothetical protein ACKVWC_010131 [Pyricularia oryzae]
MGFLLGCPGSYRDFARRTTTSFLPPAADTSKHLPVWPLCGRGVGDSVWYRDRYVRSCRMTGQGLGAFLMGCPFFRAPLQAGIWLMILTAREKKKLWEEEIRLEKRTRVPKPPVICFGCFWTIMLALLNG